MRGKLRADLHMQILRGLGGNGNFEKTGARGGLYSRIQGKLPLQEPDMRANLRYGSADKLYLVKGVDADALALHRNLRGAVDKLAKVALHFLIQLLLNLADSLL